MKQYVIATMMTMSALSLAASAPNLIECKGNGVEVGYTSTSFNGQPTFSVKLGAGGTRSFQGRSIEAQDSALGKLVTVTKQAVPDLKVETYTLLVPAANLTSRVPEVTFDTVLVESLNRTSIAGPRLVQGMITTNQFHAVKCTGKFVQF